MKYSRIVLLLAFFLSFTVATLAQGQKGEWKRPKHTGEITSEYDQANDQTKLKLHLMPVTCVRDGCIFVSLDSSFSGAKPTAAVERIIFGLSIVTKTLEPFADTKLTFRLDGELLEAGDMTFAGKVAGDNVTGLPYGITLTGDNLTKIANAKKVDVRIGSLQFAFNENTTNAIKDYHHQARVVQ